MTPVAGNGGGIVIDGVEVAAITKWSATPKPRNADTTSSSSGGSQDSVTVVGGWDIAVSIIYDSDKFPTASGIRMGRVMALVLLLGATRRPWGGYARCDGVATAVDNQNGVVTCEVNFSSTPPLWPDP